MKMVTKTFKKLEWHNDNDVEDLVTAELVKPLYLLWVWHFCRVKLNGSTVFAECEVPAKLVAALHERKAITFSVTLPAQYWV